MYSLNTLVFLTSTIVLAHDGPHETSTPAPSSSSLTISTPSSSTRSIKTVVITITHTLPAPNLSTITTSKTRSGFAVPPEVTEGAQAGEGRPTYTCTKAGPSIIDGVAMWPASDIGLLPVVTESKAVMNGTRMPMFTLDASIASIPFVGYYTLRNFATPQPTSSLSTKSIKPDSSLTTTTIIPFITHYTPTKTTIELTNSSSPSTNVSKHAYNPSDSSAASTTSSEVDITMSEFSWPATASAVAATSSLATSPAAHNGDGVVWAGADNAIPSQMQGRSLPHLYPPPLHSVGAAERRVQTPWRDSIRRASPPRKVRTHSGSLEYSEEKRGCRPCEDEGKVLCRGDVAIGVCKGGCEEMQFLGRGKGNGCEDD